MSFAAIDMPLQAVFQWVWQTSLAATVLIVLVVLALVVSRNRLPSGWRYGLWLLVLARLLWPATPPASFSIFNLAHGLWPSTGAVAVAPSTAAPPDESAVGTETAAIAPASSLANPAESLPPSATPPPFARRDSVNIESAPARASVKGGPENHSADTLASRRRLLWLDRVTPAPPIGSVGGPTVCFA